jgi:two-component system chemotaxis response regulator CheY
MRTRLPAILLVDDSATTRAMIKRVIDMAELPVGDIYEAENGQAALDQMQAHDVSLVLADLNMPGMDGMEMIKCMRADERLRPIPVVVISAQPDEDRILELKRHGVTDYLPKPFTAEAVRDLIIPNLKPPEVQDLDESASLMNLTLVEAFAEALETMAFISPELPENGETAEISRSCRLVEIGFHGQGIHGKLMLGAPVEFGSQVSIHCGASGDPAGADDALKELANVTCGLLLRRRIGGAKGFELAPPSIAAGDAGMRFTPANSVMLNADGFTVATRVTSDFPLFEN